MYACHGYGITFIFTACYTYGMERYQCDNCYKRIEPEEAVIRDDKISCLKCELERMERTAPDYTCCRCGRFFYEHEIVKIEIGNMCTACLCEEIWARLIDIQRRLEDLTLYFSSKGEDNVSMQ